MARLILQQWSKSLNELSAFNNALQIVPLKTSRMLKLTYVAEGGGGGGGGGYRIDLSTLISLAQMVRLKFQQWSKPLSIKIGKL